MDWIKYFDEKIIERGEAYYKKGKIANFYVDGLTRKATIIGSDEYDVEITFNTNGQLVAAKCNCPYAERGEYCKHMVAVLLYEERGEVAFQPKKNTSKRKSPSPSDHTEGVAYSDCIKKKQAESNFVRAFDEKTEVPIGQYKKVITAIISSYKRHGFIDYGDAGDCYMAVTEEFDKVVDFLIFNYKLKEAFEYSYFVMKKFSTTEMDDSNGEISDICALCIQVWDKLVLDESASDYMFKKVYKYLQTEHDEDWYMCEEVERFFLENFMEKKYFDVKIGYIDGKILRAKKERSDYELETALIAKLKMLEKTDGCEKEIDKIVRTYWKRKEIEKFYIKRCIDKKNYEEAERVLIKLIDRPKENGVQKGYCLQTLMNIYQETQNDKLYRDTLYQYVSELTDAETEKYLELKGLYKPEEWEDILKKLLPNVQENNKDLYAEILLKEDRKEELVDFVASHSGLGYLTKYEKDLKDDYPEKLLNKYCEELKTMVVKADDREKYKDIARLLRKMNTYEGGERIVRRLVEEWRTEYRRRPAFMQELDKVILC
jgi:hypothetical protein